MISVSFQLVPKLSICTPHVLTALVCIGWGMFVLSSPFVHLNVERHKAISESNVVENDRKGWTKIGSPTHHGQNDIV